MSERQVLATVHDHTNHALKVSASPGFVSGCQHSIEEIWNDVFDSGTNTIRTV